MAKIEINLQTVDFNTDVVKLVVLYSINGETKEYFKTLNLKEYQSFKIEDFLPNTVTEKIHFDIKSDGSVVLNKVLDGLDLIVTTDNSCCNTNDLKLNSLTVTANNLDLRHNMKIKDHVNLKITDQFNNYANISANHGAIHTDGKIHNLHKISTNNRLDISGKADVINEGVLGTAGKLVYQGHSIVNTGVMAAKDAKITLTKRHITDDDKILFTNNKLFMITNNLSFEAERNSINTGDLIVDAQANFKLSGLYNTGRIAVNSKCFIDAKTHIINKQQGSIVSAERLRLSFRSKVGKLINLGILTADKIAIRNCFDFANDINATLLTRELELLAVSSFFNAGIICGKQKCDLVLLTVDEAKAINTSNGVITSDQKINLVVKDNFSNYGKITGHTGIKGTFFGSLFNLSKGVISSEALLSLKATTELVNTSEIAGTQTDIFAKIVNNQQSGCIYGTELLKLNGTFIENAGKLYSKDQINIDVKVLIENLHSGIIQSAKNLAIAAGLKLSNAGLLQTTDYFDCSVTEGLVTNHANGTIIAQNGNIDSHGLTNAGNIKINNLDTKSHWLFNSGEMNVNLLKTTIQGIFRNLQQGLIQVETLAKIITENNFDNLGVLFSDKKIEIIGKEICNYIDGELQAKHYLYLNAVNLFIKGNVESAGDLFLIVKENFEYENVNLKANGELLLTLRDGGQVKYNINTPGDLKFEFLTKEGTWYNNAQLESGKDLLIDLPGYIIVNGQFNHNALMKAKNLLKINAKQVAVTTGSLIAKELDLHTKHHIIVGLDGSIVGINGKLHAEEGSIEQQGSIEFLKNLSLMAKKAYSYKDSTTLVGGDLEVIVDQLILEGFTKVDGEFDAKVIDFHLSQYANTLQVPVIYNGSVGQVSVNIQQADPNTGVLQAKKITISCESFQQLGGVIKSGPGGTYIEIKGDAFLEGLRTTKIWQGAISTLGRNYAIVPVFVPATIESEGDLKVTAGGKLVGASIALTAVGIKQVTAKAGVSITEKYESYDPPEYIEDDDDDDDWFDSLLSVAISAVASCFIGPAACGIFGMAARATSTVITSAAISGATQAALNGGKFKDILKSATIGAITAGVMNKIKIATPALATESTKRIVAAKNGILNSTIQTGAKIAVNGKGKIDISSFLASGTAGFSGATIDSEFGKNLTESSIKTTISTAAHGGKVIQNLATSMVEASCSHLGKTVGDEFAANLDTQRQQIEAKKNVEEKRLTDKQMLQKITLQVDQVTLINKIEDKVKLFAIQQAQMQGEVINVKEHMTNITAQVNAMDRNQIKDLNKTLDQSVSSQNIVGPFEATPVVLPLALPIATQLILRVALPSVATYFASQAMVKTFEAYQQSNKHKDPLGFPEHPNGPTIHTTPADQTNQTTPEFPIDNSAASSSSSVFPVPESLPSSEGIPRAEQIRNTLFFSRVFSKKGDDIDLPDKSSNWIKLKGSQGWKNKADGSIWRKDKLHKDHWDVMDSKENKIKEVDFFGKQIWPNGPKNKNKFPKNKN